jgi:hypothetical protein
MLVCVSTQALMSVVLELLLLMLKMVPLTLEVPSVVVESL